MNPERIKLMFVTDVPDEIAAVDPSLAEAGDFAIVGTVTPGENVLTLVTLHQPDVVVVDYDLLELDPADLTRAILREDGTIQVIMLSVVNDANDIRHAMRAGARDYLVKPLHRGELVETIRWLIGERREYARMQAFVTQMRRAYEALFTDDKPVPPTVVAFLEQQVEKAPDDRLALETLAVAYARNREWKKLVPLVGHLSQTEIAG
jgi:DNA-binding NarL/FixJ family response regulator